MFKCVPSRPNTSGDESSAFQYSIDELAIIKPAHISQMEIDQSLNACKDFTNNKKIQSQIKNFFLSKSIVPSPMASFKSTVFDENEKRTLQGDAKKKKFESECNDFSPNFQNNTEMTNICFQTDVSLPADYDLELLLCNF